MTYGHFNEMAAAQRVKRPTNLELLADLLVDCINTRKQFHRCVKYERYETAQRLMSVMHDKESYMNEFFMGANDLHEELDWALYVIDDSRGLSVLNTPITKDEIARYQQ